MAQIESCGKCGGYGRHSIDCPERPKAVSDNTKHEVTHSDVTRIVKNGHEGICNLCGANIRCQGIIIMWHDKRPEGFCDIFDHYNAGHPPVPWTEEGKVAEIDRLVSEIQRLSGEFNEPVEMINERIMYVCHKSNVESQHASRMLMMRDIARNMLKKD